MKEQPTERLTLERDAWREYGQACYVLVIAKTVTDEAFQRLARAEQALRDLGINPKESR